MQHLKSEPDRRTTTDLVFDSLYNDIATLKLLPGTKISEAEIAQRFGVSRQPVRDAFSRLNHLDLLLVRPQKSTLIRGFSQDAIARSRFIRLAVELEVIARACRVWDNRRTLVLNQNLEQQMAVIRDGQIEEFHALDLQFHSLICELSDTEYAIDVIENCRQKTDRMCVLSLDRDSEMEEILDDHRSLVTALDNRDSAAATDIVRLHLGRLDSVIDEVRQKHAEYFE